MSDNKIVCMLLIEGIAIGALAWHLGVSIIIVWIAVFWGVASRWVSWHGRGVYNAIVCNGIFDAMLVDGDNIGMIAHDANRSSAAQQEFVVCAGGELVCFLSFGCDKWRLIKEDIFNRFVIWSLRYTAVIIFFVALALVRLSSMAVYFSLQSADAGF